MTPAVLRRPFHPSGAIVSAAALFAAALYFGASRDFGAFLYGLLVLPCLWLVSGICTAVAWFRRRDRKEAGIALLLILAAPLGYYVAQRMIDPVGFLLWSPFHIAELREAAGKDQIIRAWSTWGMAGAENDSYLVSDTQDSLGPGGYAADWLSRVRQDCDVAATRRLWPHIYLVTTYNCPFDRVALPS